MTDHFDVIVIGSGAGGGTLTHALAPTGKRILLLERGDFLPRGPQNADFEPRIAQLEQDLARIGLNPFPLPVELILDESAPQFSPCVRCATCDGYPCLVKGKADAHVVGVEPALRHPNVTLRTRARVSRLETDPAGRTVNRVVVQGADGQREEYSADLVVVSAGAINSAALLLASAGDKHPHGLGNGSGVVGRNLMMHNNSSPTAFSKIPNPTRFQRTLGVNDFHFGDPRSYWPYLLGAMQMLGVARQRNKVATAKARAAWAAEQAAQTPSLSHA